MNKQIISEKIKTNLFSYSSENEIKDYIKCEDPLKQKYFNQFTSNMIDWYTELYFYMDDPQEPFELLADIKKAIKLEKLNFYYHIKKFCKLFDEKQIIAEIKEVEDTIIEEFQIRKNRQ